MYYLKLPAFYVLQASADSEAAQEMQCDYFYTATEIRLIIQ